MPFLLVVDFEIEKRIDETIKWEMFLYGVSLYEVNGMDRRLLKVVCRYVRGRYTLHTKCMFRV